MPGTCVGHFYLLSGSGEEDEMRLHEYQSKQIMASYGIPVPVGYMTNVASDVKQIAEDIAGPVVIKAQVAVGGRGKAGGIRLAKNPKEAYELAVMVLGMEIKGLPVRKVLVEQLVRISEQIYIAIMLDRNLQKPVLLASSEGGINFEEISGYMTESIARIPIDPLVGINDFQAREIAAMIDLPREHWRSFIRIIQAMWSVYNDCDATSVEINPLVLTPDREFLTLDAKILLDDNALYRHLDLSEKRDLDTEVDLEREARKYGLSYLPMQGEVACVVNGAGMAMLVMDLIKFNGGRPACFLDIGELVSAEKLDIALDLLLNDKSAKAIFINLFSWEPTCVKVAQFLREKLAGSIPTVVRLSGKDSIEGMKVLQNAHIRTASTLTEAVRNLISILHQAEENGHFD